MPPKQSMLGCLGRTGHSLTYGLEDFSFAQIWNQQAEKRATFANRSLAYIGARPGNPIHQPPFFQLTDGSPYGNARCPKLPHECCFTRKLLSRFVFAREDIPRKPLENLSVLRAI